jgi:hypothetical protein
MPNNQTFVLMNSDVIATTLRRDAAQGAATQALYDEFFATCSAHGAAKRRRQQIEAADLPSSSALDGLTTLGRRVSLLQPLVDGLN